MGAELLAREAGTGPTLCQLANGAEMLGNNVIRKPKPEANGLLSVVPIQGGIAHLLHLQPDSLQALGMALL